MIRNNINQKILVIRFSSIGDIVLSTSPLRTIRLFYPDAQITFLTLEKFAPLLEYHPDIDRLISIKSNMSLKELFDYNRYIKRNNYDIIYDLHNSIRSNLLTLSFMSQIFQIKKPRFKRFMLFYFHKNYFVNNFSSRSMYHQYLGKIWMDRENDDIPPTLLRLSNYELQESRKMLQNRGIMDDYIVVIPGAAWKQKQWSSKKYTEVLEKLHMPSVVLGLKKDIICADIKLEFSNCLDMSGKTSLREAMAIIADAKFIIGSDTGLMHAAEALGKKVSMILGPTSVETGGATYLSGSVNIQKEIWCRPCSQNGKSPCFRQKQFCLDSIDAADIMNSLEMQS
ncbi:MAG: glycosyltransferase family 9 protein [Candidatus Neomarinimicrobiota bacterium]